MPTRPDARAKRAGLLRAVGGPFVAVAPRMRPSPQFADRIGLPLLLGLAGALFTASCSPSPPARAAVAMIPPRAAATPPQGRPQIRAKHATPAEEATRWQLERLLDQYDLSPWRFTGVVEIEQGVIPHSHPVLTLSTRHVNDDLLLLATYVHEQSHWYFATNAGVTEAATADGAEPGLGLGPDLPADPDGVRVPSRGDRPVRAPRRGMVGLGRPGRQRQRE